VNLARFVSERRPGWEELDRLVTQAGRRTEKLGPHGVRRLGDLYRATAADLAVARRAFPGDPLVVALEQRVGRARYLVYGAHTRRTSVVQFFRRGYWQAIRERPVPLLIAIVLLVGSVAISGVWADRDPGAASQLAPSAYRGVTQPRPHGSDLQLSRSERTAMSSEIFTNNIRVTLLVLAAGIAFGVGSALVLLFNGILLGVVGGLAIGSGNGEIFVTLVAGHGMLELSCIVVAAAAGMRLGWSFVEPGRLTRGQALRREAHRTAAIVAGTAPWLVLAGLVEGFVTPSGLSLGQALAIGAALGVTYWTLVLVLGRPTPGSGSSPAGRS
jgi:uncharacterized membrane protein SpoIIM required for sporulation